MRIGIDARFFGSVGKGLGRYTQKLIENLEKIDTVNQYFIFLRQENFDEYVPKNSNFKKVLADYQWYSLKEQLKMPRILNKYKLDIVHFPHFNVPLGYRRKFIVTIHDLILLHFPTVRGTTRSWLVFWLKFGFYKIIIRSAIKRAGQILTVSNFTKKDLLENYNFPKDKIKVIYEASDNFCNISHKNEDLILKKYGIIKPYIIYVGNAYPHKNLERLIYSFQQIGESKNNLQLVLVGNNDYFYQKLHNLVKSKEVKGIVFTGFVTDCDLDVLYKNSEIYAFPSLYEGFGLPPLEAMAKGVPVASSDHECMKEILGESALYFDARNTKEIAQAIKTLLDNKKMRQDFISRGYKMAAKYDWSKMANQTLKAYNSEN